MFRLFKIVFQDIIRSKFIIGYTLLLFMIGWSVFNLEDNFSKGLLSLLNLILLTVPLVSIMYSTSYLYNSSEFIELLLSQPIKRKEIWVSLFLGLSGALSTAFLLGIGLPIALYAFDTIGVMMLLVGVLVSIIFVSLSMLCSILTRDKAKGMGFSIILWLFFSLLFDGLVLFLLFQFSDYPIEKMMVGISAFNPIDLSRILLLMQTDASAMMGYTGAIFRQFFGTQLGIAITFTLLCLWALLPFLISLKKFKHNDL